MQRLKFDISVHKSILHHQLLLLVQKPLPLSIIPNVVCPLLMLTRNKSNTLVKKNFITLVKISFIRIKFWYARQLHSNAWMPSALKGSQLYFRQFAHKYTATISFQHNSSIQSYNAKWCYIHLTKTCVLHEVLICLTTNLYTAQYTTSCNMITRNCNAIGCDNSDQLTTLFYEGHNTSCVIYIFVGSLLIAYSFGCSPAV